VARRLNPNRLRFFLGGADLEMVTIRDLLAQAGAPYRDRGLGWGARASHYREPIEEAVRQGETPVLVELEDDLDVAPDRLLVVDHHGARAGDTEPTALHQVFDLLALPAERWTRWLELVAANDRGHVEGLLEAGATPEEIRQVRAADRAAQGITPAEEAAAERAIEVRQELCDRRLTVVHLPHGRTAPVTDRLHEALGGPGYENLLIASPGEVNFFGSGELVNALDARWPGGWKGGALPQRGFWGHRRVDSTEVAPFLERHLVATGAGRS
jgi:hypothetical protein